MRVKGKHYHWIKMENIITMNMEINEKLMTNQINPMIPFTNQFGFFFYDF